MPTAGAWLERAACRGVDLGLFVSAGDQDDEAWEPPPEVQAVCDPCPVLGACLAWALSFDSYGYWARTSRHQRRQLRRARARQACPVCGGQVTARLAGVPVQVCVACGLSWRTGPAPAASSS